VDVYELRWTWKWSDYQRVLAYTVWNQPQGGGDFWNVARYVWVAKPAGKAVGE
jgi:hypothetical protein